MEIIELITNVAIMICFVVLAIVCLKALVDTLTIDKRKKREKEEMLEALDLIAKIMLSTNKKEEEKPKKKITKKKEEK